MDLCAPVGDMGKRVGTSKMWSAEGKGVASWGGILVSHLRYGGMMICMSVACGR